MFLLCFEGWGQSLRCAFYRDLFTAAMHGPDETLRRLLINYPLPAAVRPRRRRQENPLTGELCLRLRHKLFGCSAKFRLTILKLILGGFT
jgi:hypothetical protein